MPLYRCEAKAISRGQGRSCVAAAAYRHATTLQDNRQQLTHSYDRKGGVVHSEIITPDNAPDWTKERGSLWNTIDAAEKRKDAMTAREVLVALPRELDHSQQIEAVRSFVQEEFTARGIIADVAIHEPDARDGETQPHAHIMVSDRPLDASQPSGLSTKKDRTLADSSGIDAMRERWANHCNAALERSGLGERVDHRSLADQRRAVLVVVADNTRPEPERQEAERQAVLLDRQPEPKIGPVALAMEKQGRGGDAHALQDAMAVRADRNQLREILDTVRDLAREAVDLGKQIAEKAVELVKDARQQLLDAAESLMSGGALEAAGVQMQMRDANKLLSERDAAQKAEERSQQQDKISERWRAKRDQDREPSQGNER